MTSSQSTWRKAFRQKVDSPNIVVTVGTGDALGGRLIERAGFDGIYLSGYAVASTYGKPDVGLLTLTEMAQRAADIADAVSIPIVADADTGYGNAVNVVRTVREFERAGVAALQFEDQDLPKRCGSMPGKGLVSTEEMVGKIKAAVDTRQDPDLLIIARTDAASEEGMEAALDRLGAYVQAGADMVLALGPYDEAGARDVIRRAPAPLVYFNSETNTMPMMPTEVLQELGVALVIFPLTLTFCVAQAIQKSLDAIRRDGTIKGIATDAMLSWKECNELLGIDEIRRIEKTFG